MHRKETDMTSITIYDSEAKKIQDLADRHDMCEASVIEALFDILKENDIDIDEAW